jgi:hypothetical protein
MERGFTASSDPRELVALAAVMGVAIAMAAALPVTTAEASVFVEFVRPPVHDWLGRFDPANHVLNTLLVKRAVGLLRLSAFSLRIPELAGLALCLWALWRMPGLGRGRSAAILLAGAGYLSVEYVTPGTGVGLAIGLWLCAVWQSVVYLQGNQKDRLANLNLDGSLNLAGVCLGLSVAANFGFLIPSLLVALAAGLRVRRWTAWPERMLVTATVTAFIFLVLPFSHATARQLAELSIPARLHTARSPEKLDGLVRVLRGETRGRTVRIAASADLVPVLEFYQARYREGGWRILPAPTEADYSILDTPAAIRGQVLYRGHTVVLVH